MATTRYPSIGKCIYCGATEYASGSKRPLAEEHIIPLGLNGDHVIDAASCQDCEKQTGRMEAILLRGSLLGCRTLLGLNTRNKKDRPRALPLFDTSVTPERKVMIPIADYPVNIILSYFDDPRILTGKPNDQVYLNAWQHFFRLDADMLRRKYGLTKFATSVLDSLSLSRCLVKIGYCFAVARLGYGSFTPIVINYILGKEDYVAFRYIGGIPTAVPATNAMHQLTLETATTQSGVYLVVKIRLFAFLGAPVYRVVVGKDLTESALRLLAA